MCVNVLDNAWVGTVEKSRSGESLKWILACEVLCRMTMGWCVCVCVYVRVCERAYLITECCCCWGDRIVHPLLMFPQWLYQDLSNALCLSCTQRHNSEHLSPTCTSLKVFVGNRPEYAIIEGWKVLVLPLCVCDFLTPQTNRLLWNMSIQVICERGFVFVGYNAKCAD